MTNMTFFINLYKQATVIRLCMFFHSGSISFIFADDVDFIIYASQPAGCSSKTGALAFDEFTVT